MWPLVLRLVNLTPNHLTVLGVGNSDRIWCCVPIIRCGVAGVVSVSHRRYRTYSVPRATLGTRTVQHVDARFPCDLDSCSNATRAIIVGTRLPLDTTMAVNSLQVPFLPFLKVLFILLSIHVVFFPFFLQYLQKISQNISRKMPAKIPVASPEIFTMASASVHGFQSVMCYTLCAYTSFSTPREA